MLVYEDPYRGPGYVQWHRTAPLACREAKHIRIAAQGTNEQAGGHAWCSTWTTYRRSSPAQLAAVVGSDAHTGGSLGTSGVNPPPGSSVVNNQLFFTPGCSIGCLLTLSRTVFHSGSPVCDSRVAMSRGEGARLDHPSCGFRRVLHSSQDR